MNYWIERNLIRYVIQGIQQGLWGVEDWEIELDDNGDAQTLWCKPEGLAYRITNRGAAEIARKVT